jgi:hypothetical protein
VKWNHIRELAAECQRLLSQTGQKDDKAEFVRTWDQRLMKCLEQMDNNPEINNLSIRLLQRDRSSIKALQSVLDTRGKLTMHQFISVILPALHASLLGKPSECADSNLVGGSFYRRSKKPRVVGSIPGNAYETVHSRPCEDKAEFARQLFCRHLHRTVHLSQDSEGGSQGEDAGSHDSMLEDGAEERALFRCELLRRLHQVLSLYENVPTLPSVHSRVGRGTLKLGELQSLTKPLQLRLIPIAGKRDNLATLKDRILLNLHVEPLTSVKDLSNHVLRTCSTSHPVYKSFCRRYVASFDCNKNILCLTLLG